ncbi:MAG: hypothetical protein GXO02_02210 [Epsilonproteobacteria bacterium]|nr:hypothetical protein [Campylobacterota bacterium]
MAKIKLKKNRSLLEELGVKYFKRLDTKNRATKEIVLDDIPSDRVLEAISKVIVKNATIIAFLIGAIVTIPLVIFELLYYDKFDFFSYIFYYGIFAFISLVIELTLLYWLTLDSIYALLHLIGKYPLDEKDLPQVYEIDRILIRAALELEEPILEFMGLDPRKSISKSRLIFAALIYKLKVILSTFIIKKILKALLPRIGARSILIPWVGVFVVAFWDAYVINRSIKDAKLRLFGYYFSKYLVDNILLKKIKDKKFALDIEGAIRAIGVIMVLSKSNHPNNLILLVRLSNYLDKELNEPDSLDLLLEYMEKLSPQERRYLKVLATIAAIFDGKVTKEELEALKKIYKDEEKYYLDLLKKMQNLLKKGHIHQLAHIVSKEFNHY